MTKNTDFHPLDPAEMPRFAGPATFLRTIRHDIDPIVDVGFIGVPFDLGLNYRTGARQGPAGVREASRLIRLVHPTSGVRPYDMCNVADLGDTPINPTNKDKSIALIQEFYEAVRGAGIVPISVGGDHTIPLPILRVLAKDRPVGILQIDAHPDTLDHLSGDKYNNATFLRRAREEGLIDSDRVIQIGMRGSRFSEDDLQYGYDAGYTIITMDEYEEMGRAAVIQKTLDVLGDGPIYITIDIDGLDPAYMPGTGVPEIGGILPRDMQMILRALQGREVIGADVSEVSPCFDPTGITCLTVANLMFEILCIVTESVQKSK